MLKEKNLITISVLVVLGTAYVTLVEHFIFPIENNSIFIELVIGLIWGGFLAVMYFMQFAGMAYIYKENTKFSKVFYVFITFLFVALIWAGTEIGVHGGEFGKTGFNWTYITNLIISIVIVLKANYDGSIERRKKYNN